MLKSHGTILSTINPPPNMFGVQNMQQHFYYTLQLVTPKYWKPLADRLHAVNEVVCNRLLGIKPFKHIIECKNIHILENLVSS